MRKAVPVLVAALGLGVLIGIFWPTTPNVGTQVTGSSSAPDPEPGKAFADNVAPVTALEADRTPPEASTVSVDDDAARVCAQILDDAAEFAEMEMQGNAAELTQDSELSGDQMLSMVRSLADSPDPEHFLTALLNERPWARVSEDPSAHADLVELGLRAADSDSPLVAWHALRACVEAGEYCPYPHLEQSLLEADRDNSEAWALVASLRYERGDVAGALTAIQDAARASTSTWYWGETIALVERSLAAQTSIPLTERSGMAFGAAATALPPLQPLLGMCRAESAASRDWGEACLALSTLQAERGDTMVLESIAHSMREQTLTALGDFEGAADAAAELELFKAGRTMVGVSTIEPLLADPQRASDYLGAIRELGESDGIRAFLRQELPPLLERAGLLEREGARECVAQLFEPPQAVGTRSATRNHAVQVGDQLQISIRGGRMASTSVRVGSDGMITIPRVPAIAAAGKTTEQLEREVMAIFPERDRPGEVFVILVSAPSPEELRLEFDEALRDRADDAQ